ncbi:hypothetical protein CIT26_32335 [Mesorhizobium temperatum]|uniref:Uncharacterized protein n=1 Tax=Mesorhizobium temperatum TaxID=241416 RepID=A0A271LBX9_9HYPH|nr:hypothetical protein CIT26_32335 [Mesorhizobium temperatum]
MAVREGGVTADLPPCGPCGGDVRQDRGGAVPPPSKVLHRRDALISWHECHAIFAELDTHNWRRSVVSRRSERIPKQ